MKPPYLIFELANSHGGSKENILDYLLAIKDSDYFRKGVKFQPFEPQKIALPDFEWFPVYEKLFIGKSDWEDIIQIAKQDLDVWLDIFDLYGVEVFCTNRDKVSGIKLQASVLENHEVLSALEETGLSNTHLIINIAGHEIGFVEKIVECLASLKAKSVILQTGFQSYPTALTDTGLNKISILRAAFPNNSLCLADHVSALDPMASIIPLLGFYLGCEFIEKHFCLSRSEATYDAFSALEPSEMGHLAQLLKGASDCMGTKFINESEREYLRKSVQIPVAKSVLPKGSLISQKDLIYRRTSQKGLSFSAIEQCQLKKMILDKPVESLHSIPPVFREARISVIVAGRMKSSRLKEKALVPIHGRESVVRCLDNCLRIPHCDNVILATSTLPEDAVLEQFTLGERLEFWKGDPDDVISRYLGACAHYKIDVVVRVTADCPVVSPEIAEFLLESHFACGADYTAPRDFAVGTNSEIYNTEALARVISLLGKAEHSEYMTWYLRNNPEIFKVNLVDLPPDLVRDYRLTLDYPEDLTMFEKLYADLALNGLDPTVKNVFQILDEKPEIPKLNSHLTLKYRSDSKLIEMLDKATKIPNQIK